MRTRLYAAPAVKGLRLYLLKNGRLSCNVFYPSMHVLVQMITWITWVTALCSEGSMFRRFYIQEVVCSEGSMFRRSYIQKVLSSEGPIFRYIEKVLYSENLMFYVGKYVHLSVSGKLQCKITNHRFSF